MPAFETAVWRFNQLFNLEAIDRLNANMFGPQRTLPEILRELGAGSDRAIAVVEEWPESLQEAFRAIVHSTLNRKPRPPITISLKPDYDYELRVWEGLSVVGSQGGVYIQVRCRYPFDPHPSRVYNEQHGASSA